MWSWSGIVLYVQLCEFQASASSCVKLSSDREHLEVLGKMFTWHITLDKTHCIRLVSVGSDGKKRSRSRSSMTCTQGQRLTCLIPFVTVLFPFIHNNGWTTWKQDLDSVKQRDKCFHVVSLLSCCFAILHEKLHCLTLVIRVTPSPSSPFAVISCVSCVSFDARARFRT